MAAVYEGWQDSLGDSEKSSQSVHTAVSSEARFGSSTFAGQQLGSAQDDQEDL